VIHKIHVERRRGREGRRKEEEQRGETDSRRTERRRDRDWGRGRNWESPERDYLSSDQTTGNSTRA